MPDKKGLDVFWTNNALQNAVSIKQYLRKKFSQKEVDTFYSLLAAFEEAVLVFPELYPKANNKSAVRREVLSKPLSVFYRIKKDHIEVVAVFDNRCDLSEWI